MQDMNVIMLERLWLKHIRVTWRVEEERRERMGWAMWSAVRRAAVSPHCWELWTPNALSETKTAINYSTGTEWTSYRGEGMGGEQAWGRGRIKEIYPAWDSDTKRLFYSFCVRNMCFVKKAGATFWLLTQQHEQTKVDDYITLVFIKNQPNILGEMVVAVRERSRINVTHCLVLYKLIRNI